MVLAMVLFIDSAGIGLIIPVMPTLIEGLTGAGIDRAAEIGGWLLFSYAMMQFLFAPIIGGLSDTYGRRPVLLVTLALLGVDYALMAWAPTLAWLFAGRIISGIMGASWAAANSCIADSIASDKRGAAFGMLGGAAAAGFVFGPAIGGVIGQFGDRLPFVAAALLCAAGTIFGLIYFNETLPPEKRRPFDPFRANPFGSLIQMAKVPLVIGCIAAIFFIQLAAQSQISVWSYYGILKFSWTPIVIGMTITFSGVMFGITQGFLSGKSIARFGPVNTAKFSIYCSVPSYLIIAFAPNTAVILFSMVIGALAGMCFPALQQLMSERIDESSQGELQGAIASSISLTSIIGPPIMTRIFADYADKQGLYFPGAPFLVSAGLIVIAIAVLAVTLRKHAVTA